MTSAELEERPQTSLSAGRVNASPLPRSLSVWTGYLLGRAAQQNRDYFDGLAAPFGIKARHFHILALLSEEPGLAQIEMSERLGIDRNTVVLLLNDLESLGLVERRRDARDRRAHIVTLTAAGMTMQATGMELAQRTNDTVFAPLSPEERVQLRTLLSRLV